ncbi:hypothetical protein pb186bvf_005077 [Paramecium bursaria]
MQENIGYQIELQIHCRGLKDADTFSRSDPQVVVYQKPFVNGVYKNWTMIGETEVIQNDLNPNFQKVFVLDFIFELKQPIRFEIRDIDGDSFDDLGFCETTIGNMFGAKNQILILPISEGGKLITQCDRVPVKNEQMTFKIKPQILKPLKWCGQPSTYLKFNRIAQNKNKFFVLQTESALTNSPQFNPISSKKLGNNFQVELYEANNKFIDSVEINVDFLKNGVVSFNGQSGQVLFVFEGFIAKQLPSFTDFIRGGTQLNLVLAVDFTGSNGDPRQPSSLHYIGGQNQYLKVINTVGEILIAYDYDKNIPCYGFGAVTAFPQLRSNETLHCFPMSGDPNNSEAQGVEGIEALYKYSLSKVTLSGPTYFAPIISESMKLAQVNKQQENDNYMVLVILTDGEIHDMPKVEELIEQASFLPISIIIIGVGNDSFDMMKKLDGDDFFPEGVSFYKGRRDIVQFVPFLQFPNPQLLAKEVLHELPDQLTTYMELIGKLPRPPQQQIIQ